MRNENNLGKVSENLPSSEALDNSDGSKRVVDGKSNDKMFLILVLHGDRSKPPRRKASSKGKSKSIMSNMGGSTAAAKKKLRRFVHALSHSISDSDVFNYNRLFWLKNVDLEAKFLWEMGKELGVSCRGNEDEIIQRMVEMEQKDAEKGRPFTASGAGS